MQDIQNAAPILTVAVRYCVLRQCLRDTIKAQQPMPGPISSDRKVKQPRPLRTPTNITIERTDNTTIKVSHSLSIYMNKLYTYMNKLAATA
jgi:hypothetical protein